MNLRVPSSAKIFLFTTGIVGLTSCATWTTAKKPAGSVVKTFKTPDGWQLLVNGSPFYIKGISLNEAVGDKGEDYMQMAHDAGANSVRVYGAVTPEYLDAAQRHGLLVNVGFWFNAIRKKTPETYLDPGHRAALKTLALNYVREYKDHPAVLAWTMGNEVFGFTEKPEEKEAFGLFLEDLIQEIHRLDPNHPVIYSSAYTNCLASLKKWVPSVDIVGINVTGGAGTATHWGERNGLDRPVIVSEFAPQAAWEQKNDANGKAYDPFDQSKSETFISSWRQIRSNPASCIGGYAFVLGSFRNQDSLTWFNMNYEGLKRAAWWTLRELYTGEKPTNNPPKITRIAVSPVSDLAPGSRTTVSLTASDAENDPLTYEYFVTVIYDDPLVVEKPHFVDSDPKELSPGVGSVKVPSDEGIYRIYGAVKDGQGNIAVASRTIRVKKPA